MAALEATGISKAYGGVAALEDAGMVLRAGSVHALLGENGAGKSTLMKILTGAVRPDAGEVRLDGREVRFGDTAEAARHGVAVVSQELSLFEDLDVLSNLYALREPRRRGVIDRRAMQEKAEPVLAQLGLHVSPRQLVGELSLAQRQLVEIAKALLKDPRVLLLDEPTSALESSSSETLLDVVRVLREREVAVVFCSHILQEVMGLCDEVTVLRDGRVVLASEPIGDLDVAGIVAAMLGERADRQPQTAAADLAVADLVQGTGAADAELRLRGVTVPGVMRDVDLTARAGEVVGLAGVAGSGHTGVLEVAAGLRRPSTGTVQLPGRSKPPRNLRDAARSGVAFVSGDRRRLGLMLNKPIWENIAQVRCVGLARGGRVMRQGPLRERARGHVERLRIRSASVDAPTGSLSGGNQQKVVMAKWLEIEPTTLLLDDPTRGVDIGAKAETHELLRAVSAAGAVVVLCSTDIDELVDVCDRVVVFFDGRPCAELTGDALDQHAVLEVMNTGVVPAEAAA
jgi:ABC-type sugar transport system ATPase subunit